jgi:hypothetical protein
MSTERITPRDVAELVYGEHSPIATMGFEEAKDQMGPQPQPV